MPDEIGKLTNLEILHLNHTKVGKLPDSICNLTSLIDFDYKHSPVKEIPDALTDIINANIANFDEADDDEVDEEDGIKFMSINIVIPSTYDEDEEDE